VDAIVQKQDQINQVDSMIQMTLQRMGNPVWLEEKGQNVERLTGEPGTVVRWQRTTPQLATAVAHVGREPAEFAIYAPRAVQS
jgi:hypothetical protein